MTFKRFYISGLLLFLFNFLFSSSLKDIGHLTDEFGLSNNSVQKIVQDKNKFIWIATDDGLNRFNGKEFITYRFDPKDSTSIPDNEISTLYIDSKGVLWIGTTRGGVCIYDPLKDAFCRLVDFTNKKISITHDYVTGFTEDKQGNIWIATIWGLNCYNKQTCQVQQFYSYYNIDTLLDLVKKLKSNFPENFHEKIKALPLNNKNIQSTDIINMCANQYPAPLADKIIQKINHNLYNNLNYCLLHNKIRSICSDKNDNIWIGYENEAFSKFNTHTQKYTHFPFISNKGGSSSIYAHAILTVKDEVYIGYDSGEIDVVDINTLKISRINNLPKIKHIRNISVYDTNHIWIAAEKYFLIVNTTDKTYQLFNDINKTKVDFNSLPISCLFIDSQKNKWVGTQSTGVYIINEFKGFNIIDKSNYLSDNYISAIALDKNENIWVGYYQSGLDFFNPGFKNRKTYSHNPYVKGSFNDETVFSIFQDSNNNIWASNYQQGWQRFNPQGNNFESYKSDIKNPYSLPSNDIRSVTEDNKGNIWLATMGGGLCRYEIKSGKFYTYRANYTNWEKNLSSDWLFDVEYDKTENLIWVGSTEGISVFNYNNGTFKSYKKTNTKIPHNVITSIYIDSHNNVWFGTKGGLAIFDKKSNDFHVFTIYNGLPNNDVKAIVEDKDHTFWISTNFGIINCKAYIGNTLNDSALIKSIKKFDVNDGLSSNEFIENAAVKTKDGLIMFGSKKGITLFNPNEIILNNEQPSIIFSSVKLFNEEVHVNKEYNNKIILHKPLYLTDTLVFDYEQNLLTIGFVALNYIQPFKNKYKYKLVGFNKEWEETSNNEVTYMNLKPGTYYLNIKACNNDGVWNNIGKKMVIIIKPPFWNTLWFRIIIILFTVIVLISFYYIRLSRINNRNELLEKLIEQRTREIEDKNKVLIEQAEELNSTNQLLAERHAYIEEQSEELKKQRDELHHLNATKDKLFSILAHDLRSPFNAILGFSEILITNLDKYPKEKIVSQLNIIRDATRFTYNLLENLLQWSRTQRGAIEYLPQNINIMRVFESDLNVLLNQALRKEIIINHNIIGTERLIYVDPNMISLVMRNLISNAIKYSYKKGTINITITFNTNEFLFLVQDFGLGITDELKSKLFTLDEFVSKPGTEGEKGTGLGLLLCSDFIARHKGKIWVESEDGKGSKFYFSIPNK
jgi:signal transduction histidine kinase/ligand-binding sensor domain-containing protein